MRPRSACVTDNGPRPLHYTAMSELDEKWPEAEAPTVVAPGDTALAPPPPPPVAPPPPEPGLPPDRRIGAGMLLGIAAILLVAAGLAIAWFLTHRHHSNSQPTTVVVTTTGTRTTVARIAVPTVTGLSLANAKTNLKQLGLDSTVRRVSSSKPSGSVVSQIPAPGTKLAKGGVVNLTVAKGAPTSTTTTPAATTTTSNTTTTTSTTPTTTAASTTPSTTPAQTTPAQPQTATMPDVTSQTEAAAVQAMGQAGILPSLSFVANNDPLGTVEAQAKPSGTQLPAKSHVQINVSSGPGNKPMETVPNVVGQTLKGALAKINGAHLRLIYLRYPVTSQSQAGKVVQQSPLGGQAPQNAQILVFLGALSR